MRPALDQDVIWCQLFSEPDAGSDAAGIKTKATRVDGGWLVNGQKVWTSGAHVAGFGLRHRAHQPRRARSTTASRRWSSTCTPRASRCGRCKMPTGDSEFNEVFFNDVFVPDDDVVGPVDGGWTVARATLGNESVSIGGGAGRHVDARPTRSSRRSTRTRSGSPAAPAAIGRYIAEHQAMGVLNLRSAHRAVAGGGPGPEGNVTKLVLSEIGHEAAAILAELSGPDARVPRRRRRDDRHAGADAPGHVDRRRHVGDQAQPDRRAHPRPARATR